MAHSTAQSTRVPTQLSMPALFVVFVIVSLSFPALAGGSGTWTATGTLKKMLIDPDPFVRQAAIMRLASATNLREQVELMQLSDPRERIGLLLAWRASRAKDSRNPLPDYLADPDPDVQFLAVKWVSDEKLTQYRPEIERMVKSTSLASIIGFVEITRAGQIINNVTFRPFLVFGLVATIYFLLCWLLSHLSQRLERRYGTAQR